MYENTSEYWNSIMEERLKGHNCLTNFDTKYLQKWLVREKGRDISTMEEVGQNSFVNPWKSSQVSARLVAFCLRSQANALGMELAREETLSYTLHRTT